MKGKVDFWLYSQGTVEYRQGDIVYKPLVFKLGKVPLPKAFVMRKLQEFSYDGVEVAEDEIVMKKELFPLEITSLTIAENKLSVELKKITVDIPIDSSDAESSISAKPVVQPTEEKAGNSNPENSRSQEEEEPSEPAPTETEEAKVLLQSVYSDLSVVYSSVKTSKEKQIIGAMMGTVSNLIEDPASSYKSEAAWVVAEYKKLSEEEKNDLKQAMLTNMDIRTAIEVKSLFGL
jgi:hypothetical protein